MEEAFLWFRIKSMFMELLEYFTDVFLVLRDVIGVNEDVVEVNDNRNIEHVRKDVVHKMLECGRGIGETFRDDHPFIGAIASAECSFPLIAFRNSD